MIPEFQDRATRRMVVPPVDMQNTGRADMRRKIWERPPDHPSGDAQWVWDSDKEYGQWLPC